MSGRNSGIEGDEKLLRINERWATETLIALIGLPLGFRAAGCWTCRRAWPGIFVSSGLQRGLDKATLVESFVLLMAGVCLTGHCELSRIPLLFTPGFCERE